MSETSVIAILASVGILLSGTVSADAAALASAVKVGLPDNLVEFVKEFPESKLAPDALLLASQLSLGKAEDNKVSSSDPRLTCNMRVARSADGKAVVSWETTGAAAMGLSPYGFPEDVGPSPSGQLTFDADDFTRFAMTVMDAAGNRLVCWVSLAGEDIDLNSLATPKYTPLVEEDDPVYSYPV